MLFLVKMETALNSLRKEKAPERRREGARGHGLLGCAGVGSQEGRVGLGEERARLDQGVHVYHNEAKPEATVFFAPAYFPTPLLGFILKSNFRSAFLLCATKRSGR